MGIKLRNNFFEQEKQLKSIYRHLLVQMVIMTILYAVVSVATYILLVNILEQFTDLSYLLNWIEVHRVSCAFVYITIGYVVILLHYWKKPFGYLNDILTATTNIYHHEEKMVTLPTPLKTVEVYLNELRSTIERNGLAAQKAEQRKYDLISYLAHDLKTPLTSIVGYVSLLDDAPDLPLEQRAKYVHITFEKAQRLEKLINEFFDITRYNLQQIELEKEKIDLYYMLVQMTDEFYPLLSAHGNTVKLSADEELAIYGDPIKLARVFNNILKNAISYSYPDTEIIVSAKVEQDNIVIIFKNRGKTIPTQEINALFEKFFRLDEARTSNTGGAGLGLAIAKDIVILHDGSIKAESQNDITTFVIRLPNSDYKTSISS